MVNENIPFQSIDWTKISQTEDNGDTGISYTKTLEYDGLKIRIVEYSKNFSANHWCEKGHIVQCLEGSFDVELKNGKKETFTEQMSFVVSDGMSFHRLISKNGAKVLIIDGNFLKKIN